MRFNYAPEDDPDVASAEALQEIARQLERLAGAVEEGR